jgi:hypothetical protein
MTTHRTLAVVGASEETIAHLRLLMRLGQTTLRHRWDWGTEAEADLIIVEPTSLACSGVQERCQAAGIPCALLCDADEIVVHGLVLRRPLKMAQVVAVLNAAGATMADKRSADVDALGEDFYVRELEEFQPPARSDNDDVWMPQARPSAMAGRIAERAPQKPASDLDTLIHGDPLIEPEAPKRLIEPDTWVQPSSGEPSRRSESRADESRHRVPSGNTVGIAGVTPIDPLSYSLPVRDDDRLRETETLPAAPLLRSEGIEAHDPRLIQYVEEDLLRSPSQLSLDGLPAIIFDPKAKLFHVDTDLSELAVYWRQSLARPIVRTVSTTDLARARAAMPGRSYDELRWLDVVLAASGRLNGKLDPGGSFCVRQPVSIAPGFRAHGPISAALASPARAHEIAAASGAPMEQVFDMINAYDAIGRLQWTPRQRRSDGDEPARPASGPLSRLKWPFGKR